MATAMTNEERFIASCNTVGEADVRQKLSAGRYSERRAEWAGAWLEQKESGKTEATRAAERSSLLRKPTTSGPYSRFALWALVFAVLLASATLLLNLS